MTLPELADFTADHFVKTCGRAPVWIAAAPGRVNVIGEHTDYNDGFVLPMAIERYTVIAAAPAAKGSPQIHLHSTARSGEPAVLSLSQPMKPFPKGSWANYAAGVVAGFVARGIHPGGFDALIHSNVPLGGGLSSSASLEVATATLLETMTGQTLDPVAKALLCQKAEHDFAGSLRHHDEFISVMGRKDNLLLLDCRSRQTELVPMSDPAAALLVTNTNVKHELSGGEYAQRRAQCEAAAKALGLSSLRDATPTTLESAKGRMEEVVFRRARHVIGEIERTPQAATAIRASNWLEAGHLMYASHNSLRDDYEVSCPELDVLVEIAQTLGSQNGVYGSRMTGGGFGGCTVTLVRTDAVEAISRKFAEEYKRRTGIDATLFVSRPAAGASVLKGQ